MSCLPVIFKLCQSVEYLPWVLPSPQTKRWCACALTLIRHPALPCIQRKLLMKTPMLSSIILDVCCPDPEFRTPFLPLPADSCHDSSKVSLGVIETCAEPTQMLSRTSYGYLSSIICVHKYTKLAYRYKRHLRTFPF